jgi:uncharacterized membrane protein YhaH (DUF805 family)
MNLFQLLFGDWIKLLFDFGGRINRAKYWQTVVIYLVGLLVFYILALVVAAVIGIPELATLFVLLAFIAVVISSTAVGIKRLHDRNKSGWWLLAFYLLPGLLGFIGPYTGFDPAFQLAGAALSIWALIELGFLRGTSGRNPYGPDPLAVSTVRRRD